mmetsp:Transcript_25559/g.35268  ORF Transcript_25559/g.35268 Transcript_25559/m.35268 type:complete len:128 (-) Transcript_25559:184-567(-)|eukprot:CAMPEP_0196583508 /NCGR_PEP_ID=MMETSP1081-20130531/43873_1 /TAXON_ID=36882 /ORGANISM="Pyramimonas amylifera, Strain CCMP720" /LENGTH=127 /DNA_ID=CAMNT_0041904425 /DNA_START=121 /DNA_END=504 /DNA_ORIENTATION=+
MKNFSFEKAQYIFKRAQRGIFAQKTIAFGNRVSDCGGNLYKSRRSWKPNVQVKKVYSELMGKQLRLHVTCHALRCIDNKGGLDNYLLRTDDSELASAKAISLKKELQTIVADRQAHMKELLESSSSN